jgi:hypothetical protein
LLISSPNIGIMIMNISLNAFDCRAVMFISCYTIRLCKNISQLSKYCRSQAQRSTACVWLLDVVTIVPLGRGQEEPKRRIAISFRTVARGQFRLTGITSVTYHS